LRLNSSKHIRLQAEQRVKEVTDRPIAAMMAGGLDPSEESGDTIVLNLIDFLSCFK
jgi:hypothetical protein